MNDDELISAYFDGELQGADLARAEQLLAASAASRQLLDELRALRGSLQGLPRQSLGDDFAERVLRRAEREVLLPTPSDLGLQEPDAPTAASVQTAERGWWRPEGRRPWVYAVAALAAGLLVMVLTSEQQQGPFQNVAFHDAPADTTSATARRLSETSRSESTVNATSNISSTTSLDRGATMPMLRGGAVEGASGASAPAGQAGAVTFSGTATPLGSGAMSIRNGIAETSSLTTTAATPNSLTTETFNFRASGDLPGLRESLEAAGAGEWYTPLVRQTAQTNLGGFITYTGGTTVSAGVLTTALAGDLVIVQCHIRPNEWRETEFEQLLGDNSIQVQPAAESAKQNADRTKLDNLTAKNGTNVLTRDTKLEGATAGKAMPLTVDTNHYDAYYVVADTEQLAATVAKLSQQRGAVVDVQVAATPSAPQQKVWDQYGVRVTPTAEAQQLAKGVAVRKNKSLQDDSSPDKKLAAEKLDRITASTPAAPAPAPTAAPEPSAAKQAKTLQPTTSPVEQQARSGYAQRLFLLTQEESLGENKARLGGASKNLVASPSDERKRELGRDLKKEGAADHQDAGRKDKDLAKLGVELPAQPTDNKPAQDANKPQAAHAQPQPTQYQRALFVFRTLEPSPGGATAPAAKPASPAQPTPAEPAKP